MPAHDFADAAERVIDDDGQLIAEKPVRAAEDEVAAVVREVFRIQSVMAVAHGDGFIRHAQAIGRAAGFHLFGDFLRRKTRARAAVNGRVVAAVGRVGGVELGAGAEAGVNQLLFIEHVEIALIKFCALALHKRRLIPDQAQPCQIG